MKLVQKLALVLVIVTMLVASFAVFVGASDSFTEANIEEILEYYVTRVYAYDHCNEDGIDGITEALLHCTKTVETDPDDPDNSVWHLVPQNLQNANIVTKFPVEEDSLVISIRVKFDAPVDDGDDETEECAPTFEAFIKMNKDNSLFDTATFFKIDYKTGEIVYCSYDEQTGRLNKQHVATLAPEYGVWYNVDIVFDFENDAYSLSIVGDNDKEFKAESVDLGEFANATECRLLLSKSRLANMWYDYIKLYEGSFVRDIDNKNNITAEALVNLDALSKTSLSLENKVRIADVYRTVLVEHGFVPKAETPGLDELNAIIESDIAYMNDVYIEALCAYVNAIDTTASYYDRVDYVAFVDRFSELLPENQADLEALPGYADGDFEATSAARAALEAERAALNEIKLQSDEFILKALAYEPDNTSYVYMCQTYDDLASYTKRDVSYNGVADANAIMSSLDLKIKAIVATVKNFSDHTNAMAAKIDALTTPVSGDVFETLYYTNYKTALAVYNDGVLYEGLDNATYPGLSDTIALFLAKETYVLDRVRLSIEFKEYVREANSSTHYSTMKEKLDLAAYYIDESLDDGKSVEVKYEGVVEAIALYNELRARIQGERTAAELYVAEVAKITDDLGYAALKAAVDSALKLKDSGNVGNIPATDTTAAIKVTEANAQLAKYEAKIAMLEGYSKMLIDCVNALNAAESNLTLEQRRELIVIAINAKGQSEDTISGVTAAKTGLDTAIAAYNADVAAANGALTTALTNAATVTSGAAPQSVMNRVVEIIKALFTK